MTAREEAAHYLAGLLKKARRQMTNAIRDHLEPTGTSLPAIQILKRAAAGGSLSQLDLAQELELEPAALSRLVAELEADDLVVRRRDPHDNRRLLMEATPAGLSLLERARPLVLRGVDTMASRLTEDERRELCRLLEKISGEDDAGPAKPQVEVKAPLRRKSRRPTRTKPGRAPVSSASPGRPRRR